MLKRVLFAMVLVLVLVCIHARGGKKGRGNQRAGQQGAKDCSEWTYGDCTFQANATCGRGNKKGVRTGDNCSVKEKSFPCKVPCLKNKCKYQKGEWSECDLATNTMTRTNTLKKGDATVCQASKAITKKCKNKKAPGNRQSNRKRKPSAAGSE